MLVLTRRPDEKIVFPGLGITVQVLQIKSNQIKIGIDAPASVTILRAELENGFRAEDNAGADTPVLCRKG